jgi:trimeric autotransporter adhesin
MNTIYKLVWNAATGSFVAASELAKGRKKADSRMKSLAVATAMLFGMGSFNAALAQASAATDETACVTANGEAGATDASGLCKAAIQGVGDIGMRSIDAMATLDDTVIKVNGSTASTATGTVDIAIGNASNADSKNAPGTSTGDYSIAIGDSAQAVGGGNTVLGSGAVASNGSDSVALQATAIGGLANASGEGTVALGYASKASGANSTAIGSGASASGSASIAIGGSQSASAQAAATHSIAIGESAAVTSAGSGSVALGEAASVSAGTSVAIGQSANATASNAVALGANSVANQANTVSVGNGTTNSKIVNMANGVNANDALNVSQLSPALTALGATMDANGNVTGPTFNLANGGTSTTIGAALTGLDNALSTANTHISDNSSAISSLQDQLESGTVGLVQQDATTGNITVAADTNGSVVDFTGTDGTRTLTGVTAGSVSSTSTDAVNGAQLYGVSESVAKAIGGNAAVNADGTLSAPSFTVGDGNGGTVTVNSLGDAISNVDGRVTTNEGAIGTLTDQLNSGSVGLVQQASVGANLTVGANTNGAAVDFTGTDGMRILTGVANGVGDDDAVTMSQLKAAGLYDPSGDPMTVISYDDHSLASATLGGTNGTVINNLAPGLVAAGSMQAVNGGQLFDLQQNFQSQYDSLNSQYSNLNDRVGTIEQGIVDGTIGGPGGGDGAPGYGPNPGSGDNSVVIGDGANASGDSSTAIGNGSVASGDSSTAVGNGSVASGSNSTASGANAQATGSNSTATGANAVASGAGSTAAGESASATGNNSTALGSNSSATGNNSVALGAGSVADRDNTVSVGAPGAERQITNVAAGTQRTDAANWGQVQDAVNGVQDWANQKFTQMNKRISGMGAMSAASTQMAVNAAGVSPGKGRIAMGVGYQGGQSALSVGYAKAINERARFSIGGAVSGSDANVGVGFGFDL